MDSLHHGDVPAAREGYEPPEVVLIGTIAELTLGFPDATGDDLLDCCSTP